MRIGSRSVPGASRRCSLPSRCRLKSCRFNGDCFCWLLQPWGPQNQALGGAARFPPSSDEGLLPSVGRVASPHQAGGGVAYQHHGRHCIREMRRRSAGLRCMEVGSRGRSWTCRGRTGRSASARRWSLRSDRPLRWVHPRIKQFGPVHQRHRQDSRCRTPNGRAPGSALSRPSKAETAACSSSTTPGDLRLRHLGTAGHAATGSGRTVSSLLQRNAFATCTQPGGRVGEVTRVQGLREQTHLPKLAGSRPGQHSSSRCLPHCRWSRGKPKISRCSMRTLPDPPQERPEALAQINASIASWPCTGGSGAP